MVPRIAVVGCGAVAESYFLPVLTTRRDLCAQIVLVDSNIDRAASLAEKFRIDKIASSLTDVLDQIDVGVIATPHDSHFAIGKTLIAAGKHVFCEKPLTTAPEEAMELAALAHTANLVFMTNNWRRNNPAIQEVNRIIKSGRLGAPLTVKWTEGYKFSWPTKSGFYFTQKPKDGLPPPGVMLDIGSHVVDLLCWWLGDCRVLSCSTDSFGGPEARASLVLQFGPANAVVNLSYYQKLINRFEIRFEDGQIIGGCGDDVQFTMVEHDKSRVVVAGDQVDFGKHAVQMISNFVGAINGRNDPLVTAGSVVPSIRAISAAYHCAKPYDAFWLPRGIGA